jgi:hypothetical protein
MENAFSKNSRLRCALDPALAQVGAVGGGGVGLVAHSGAGPGSRWPLRPEACEAGVRPGRTTWLTWASGPWVCARVLRCLGRLSLSSSLTRAGHLTVSAAITSLRARPRLGRVLGTGPSGQGGACAIAERRRRRLWRGGPGPRAGSARGGRPVASPLHLAEAPRTSRWS